MNIDLIPNGSIKRVHVSQNDVGRTLTFELFNNSTSYTVPSGATVKIQGTKPSGFGFSEVCSVSGNTITIDTTETMTDEYGYIETELVIESSGDVLGTSNFILAVEKNPHPSNTTDGTQITAQSLQVQIDELAEIIESADSGLTDEVKQALLNCFAHVAWIDEHGQTYYDALEEALYPPATLTSISAVYTQSGTVYDTDSLDSLKSDLVVTAHYSDSSTETVTSYTLSGTLTVGTSTITVAYGGKTTTFTVAVSEVPTLSSISAVYTQSGTVYDTDSLDDLKADLVVTAHYSDSTTQTVSDYTLSGTLTEGTSTITVAYSGKTTTFNVTVSVLQKTRTITVQLTSGYYIEPNDGLEKENASRSADFTYYDCSDAYAIDFRQPYTNFYVFYDESKQRISGGYGTGSNVIAVVPIGAKYFRTSYLTTAIAEATITLYIEGANISGSVGWSDTPTGFLNPNNGDIQQTGSNNYLTQINTVPDGAIKVAISNKGNDYSNLFLCFYNGDTFVSTVRSDGTTSDIGNVPTNATNYAMQAHPKSESANEPSEQIAIVFI